MMAGGPGSEAEKQAQIIKLPVGKLCSFSIYGAEHASHFHKSAKDFQFAVGGVVDLGSKTCIFWTYDPTLTSQYV